MTGAYENFVEEVKGKRKEVSYSCRRAGGVLLSLPEVIAHTDSVTHGQYDARPTVTFPATDYSHCSVAGKGKEGNEEYLYSAFLDQGTHKALRHGSHSFTCKQHHALLISHRTEGRRLRLP